MTGSLRPPKKEVCLWGQNDEAVMRQWFDEIWNKRRPETIAELLAPESLAHVEGMDIVGPDQFREYYSVMITVFPDLRISVHGHFSRAGSCGSLDREGNTQGRRLRT